MKNYILNIVGISLLGLGVTACSETDTPQDPTTVGKQKIEFSFNHPDGTKATETNFEKDDVVGVFVCENAKPLEIAGNLVNNEKFTFDGSAWKTAKPLYWDDGSFDAYAYYPYIADVNSTTDLEVAVKLDQRDKGGTDSEMSAYEASDLLYANSKKITASSTPINLQFRHVMSKVTIRLIKGEDYEGEIPETGTVMIHNTVPDATLDLQAGIVTKDPKGARKTIYARQVSQTSYTAILVPQRLDNRVPLVEVLMNGVSFLYEARFQFKPGMHHILNLVIDDNPEKIKIEIGGEINNWN